MKPESTHLAQGILSDKDLLLLRLSLSEGPTQEELDKYLEGWDLDTAPMTEAVLLSYLLKMHPGLQVPAKIGPRLSGLLNYCRFQYLRLVGQFGIYCHALTAEGIRFLVMKGGAMKALRPDFPRWMGDIDILVQEGDYQRAEQVARSCGYTLIHSAQSFDMKKDGQNIVDVHRFVPMHTGRERAANPGFFARSTSARIFSIDAMMPSREDLLFMTLVNLIRNLADDTGKDSILYSFFDVRFLLTPQEGQDFDWTVVRDNAALTGTAAPLEVARRFLNGIIPGLIPEDVLQEVSEKEIDKALTWILYRRDVLRPEREQIGEFNPVKALKAGKAPIPYVCHRIRFFMHKRLEHCTSASRRILRRRQREC